MILDCLTRVLTIFALSFFFQLQTRLCQFCGHLLSIWCLSLPLVLIYTMLKSPWSCVIFHYQVLLLSSSNHTSTKASISCRVGMWAIYLRKLGIRLRLVASGKVTRKGLTAQLRSVTKARYQKTLNTGRCALHRRGFSTSSYDRYATSNKASTNSPSCPMTSLIVIPYKNSIIRRLFPTKKPP
jgi:hypothetical protein